MARQLPAACEARKDDLAALALGDLAPETETALRGHLEACASCRGYLAALTGTVGAWRALPLPEPPPDLTRRILESARKAEDAPAAAPAEGAGESTLDRWLAGFLELLRRPIVAAAAAAALIVVVATALALLGSPEDRPAGPGRPAVAARPADKAETAAPGAPARRVPLDPSPAPLAAPQGTPTAEEPILALVAPGPAPDVAAPAGAGREDEAVRGPADLETRVALDARALGRPSTAAPAQEAGPDGQAVARGGLGEDRTVADGDPGTTEDPSTRFRQATRVEQAPVDGIRDESAAGAGGYRDSNDDGAGIFEVTAGRAVAEDERAGASAATTTVSAPAPGQARSTYSPPPAPPAEPYYPTQPSAPAQPAYPVQTVTPTMPSAGPAPATPSAPAAAPDDNRDYFASEAQAEVANGIALSGADQPERPVEEREAGDLEEARTRLAQGDAAGAAEAAERARRTQPQDEDDATYLLAQARARQGRWAEAARAYELFVALHPGDSRANEARWQAADAYARAGAASRSATLLRQLVGVPGYDSRARAELDMMEAPADAAAGAPALAEEPAESTSP